jgi:hypothetical protein
LATGKSIARTAIGWGLVSIPVSLSLAASAKDSTVQMHQYSPTGNRIAQKRVDSVTGEEVAFADIRKGVEHGLRDRPAGHGLQAQAGRGVQMTRVYGERIEKRRHGQAVVLLGKHTDEPMPLRAV